MPQGPHPSHSRINETRPPGGQTQEEAEPAQTPEGDEETETAEERKNPGHVTQRLTAKDLDREDNDDYPLF